MTEIKTPENDFPYRFARYTAIGMTIISAVTFVMALLTPPVSGPYCPADCLEYPFPGMESRFPRDYYWMYPAIILNIVFVVLSVCIHQYASPLKKVFSRSGMAFAIISAGILVTNYFVQVTVIQPSILNGETDGILLLTQFNPHGLFIALEEIGLLMMSLAFLFLAFVFHGNPLEITIRWIFILSFILAILSLVLVSVIHGIHREYHFEVLIISINWLVLIVTGVLLARVFRRSSS
jgi:hypothetical protein